MLIELNSVTSGGYPPLDSYMVEAIKRIETELSDAILDLQGSIKAVKDDMLDLEKRISAADQSEKITLQNSLMLKSNELNYLSDSAVSLSRKAWTEFNQLAQRHGFDGDDSIPLESIRTLCKRIEEIASDLLCFSLGH
jgi:hypothetical protein